MEFHSPADVLHCSDGAAASDSGVAWLKYFQNSTKGSIETVAVRGGRFMILKQARSLRKETCWADRLAKTNYLGAAAKENLFKLRVYAGRGVRRDPRAGEVGTERQAHRLLRSWPQRVGACRTHTHPVASWPVPGGCLTRSERLVRRPPGGVGLRGTCALTAISNQEGTCMDVADVAQALARARLGWDTPAGPPGGPAPPGSDR